MGNHYQESDVDPQEFMNSLVRPSLQTYPEDSGEHLQEACQAGRWKDEVDGELAAPMARSDDNKDYFIWEPCLAHLNTGPAVVTPSRWFRRGSTIWSKAHRLSSTYDGDGYTINEHETIEIKLSAYFLNVIDLSSTVCQDTYGIPPPVIKCTFSHGVELIW